MHPLQALSRNYLFLPIKTTPPSIIDRVEHFFRLVNPKAQALRKLNKFSDHVPDFLLFTRRVYVNQVGECVQILREALESVRFFALLEGYDLEIIDLTTEGEPISLEGEIHLRDYQETALTLAKRSRGGIIIAPPGSGKTVIGLAILQAFGRRAMWITHTKELANQALQRMHQFFRLEKGDVDIYGAGSRKLGKKVTIATVQTLIRGIPSELLDTSGVIILDEAHHAPARTFEEVVSKFPGRYRFGLTATPNRSDGLTDVMYWTLGPQLFYISREELCRRSFIVAPKLEIVHTGFKGRFINPITNRPDYALMVNRLTKDRSRNNLIISKLAEEPDRYALVLSGRKKHCNILYEMLHYNYPHISAAVLTSDVPTSQRKSIMQDLINHRIHVVFATSIAEEGLDVAHLDRLHLVTPSKNERLIAQAVGRIMRPCEGKKDAIVYDYVDDVPLARYHFRERMNIYAEECGLDV